VLLSRQSFAPAGT